MSAMKFCKECDTPNMCISMGYMFKTCALAPSAPPAAPPADRPAWKFTGIGGLKRYLTDKQYAAQTPGVQRFYEPVCRHCAENPIGAPPAQAADLQERYDFILRMCREAQDAASQRGWALHAVINDCATLESAKQKAREGLIGSDAGRAQEGRTPIPPALGRSPT